MKIIQLCERHEEEHRLSPYYRRYVVLGPWFIKYDGHGTLELEYKTHEYLLSKTIGNPSAPRIPQVVAYFTPEQQWAYLVTERIDPFTSAYAAPEAVAKALQWLRCVPPLLASHSAQSEAAASAMNCSRTSRRRYPSRVRRLCRIT
jgi:hypothetical protein